MKCPGCGKEGPYIEENGYEILGFADGEAHYRCEDCGTDFWDL